MFETKNTKFAACLSAMGYEPCPDHPVDIRFIGSGALGVFRFIEKPEMRELERLWAHNPDIKGPAQFVFMYRACKARDWMISRVIHGTHNEEAEIPAQTFGTELFKLACCLVALGFYLHKFDRGARKFYFDQSAFKELKRYVNPSGDAEMSAMKLYLNEYDSLNAKMKMLIDKSSHIVHSPNQTR